MLGRFTSPDEFTGGPNELFDFSGVASENPTFYADLTNPQSLNKYLYCLNNPLIYIDPDGHQQALTQQLLWQRTNQQYGPSIGRAVDTIHQKMANPLGTLGEFQETLRKWLGTDRESIIWREMERGSTRERAEFLADLATAFNDQAFPAGGITKTNAIAKSFGFKDFLATGNISSRTGILASGELMNGGSVVANFVQIRLSASELTSRSLRLIDPLRRRASFLPAEENSKQSSALKLAAAAHRGRSLPF